MLLLSSISSPHLSARLVCSCPAIWPLGFGAWCQRGRGSEYVRSRGNVWDGFDSILLVFCVWYFVHSHLLSCIALYTCDGETYVTCVLSTLIYIYVMSLGYAHLLCFCILLQYKWALLMLISYHCVGLGHISMPNPISLVVKCLDEPSMLKTSPISYTHTQGYVVINHQKGGDWKHLGL